MVSFLVFSLDGMADTVEFAEGKHQLLPEGQLVERENPLAVVFVREEVLQFGAHLDVFARCPFDVHYAYHRAETIQREDLAQ